MQGAYGAPPPSGMYGAPPPGHQQMPPGPPGPGKSAKKQSSAYLNLTQSYLSSHS